MCSYLVGEAFNADRIENLEVLWVPQSDVTRFIPAELIYPPVLEALESPS